MRAIRARAALLVAVAVGSWVAGPSALLAVSPSPEASFDVERPGRPEIQAWLDAPLPDEPQPGDDLTLGVMLWDSAESAIPTLGNTLFMRAIPTDGAAEPTETTAISDWRGHFRGTVRVPPGGLAGVELGLPGTICENDACRPDDWIFGIAGAGPPPEAPITLLAEARIEADDTGLVAGQRLPVGVTLVPNAAWAELPLPGAVVVRAREARGPNVAVATLPLANAGGLAYDGSITIPRGGELVLEAATDEDGGDATRFGTSMVRVVVAGAPADDPPTSASSDDAMPFGLVLLLAAVALVGAGVVVAGFRGSAS
jgi:hypothetical protein